MPERIRSLLVANRGEIAIRVMRAATELGIRTIAIYSQEDRFSLHRMKADESYLVGAGRTPVDAYLDIADIVRIAQAAQADAIHPGYGFLSENPAFAEACAAAGLIFVGPTPQIMRRLGNKVSARELAVSAGVPVMPATPPLPRDDAEAARLAAEVGYPVMLKASWGGGGRGMRVIASESELAETVSIARREAKAAFGNDEVYLEKLVVRARHIEVQLLGDGRGEVIHLGERDCSLQRSHQKLLEEAPSPALDPGARERLLATAVAALKELGYKSAGTMEFLYQDGEFYFIEMNTRLQVEHPVSEMITGIDLVREQIRVASGAPLGMTQADITFNGHAIECRINAENPETFAPSPGKVTEYHAPGGLGVRVDSALYGGYRVPPHYDSLIAKLIVHGRSRNECMMRLRRALEEMVINGVHTSIPVHRRIMGAADFLNGSYDIRWLEKFVAEQQG